MAREAPPEQNGLAWGEEHGENSFVVPGQPAGKTDVEVVILIRSVVGSQMTTLINHSVDHIQERRMKVRVLAS